MAGERQWLAKEDSCGREGYGRLKCSGWSAFELSLLSGATASLSNPEPVPALSHFTCTCTRAASPSVSGPPRPCTHPVLGERQAAMHRCRPQ